MRFWDASAVILLCVRQDGSASALRSLESDSDLMVWWATQVECASAFCRLRRQHDINAQDQAEAYRWLEMLQGHWHEVSPTGALRGQARRLLELHPLRAADALQLASALVWAAGEPKGLGFVAADQRLALAALQEGFEVHNPLE